MLGAATFERDAQPGERPRAVGRADAHACGRFGQIFVGVIWVALGLEIPEVGSD